MLTESEYEILSRLQIGDHQAFCQIYDNYKLQLTASVLRLLRIPDLAEEVIQDTFVALWENRGKLDIEKPIKPYLYTIAANKTKNLFRRAASDMRAKDNLFAYFEESYNPIMDSIFRKEYQRYLEDIFSKLTPQQAAVYRLCKLENRSYKEVSEQLGIAEGTINVHIREANRRIKVLIAHNPDIIFLLLFFLKIS